MNKKLVSLILSSLFTVSVLSACGDEEPATVPPVTQAVAAAEPQAQPSQAAAPTTAKATTKKKKTTTPAATATTDKTQTASATATTTTAKPADNTPIEQKIFAKVKTAYEGIKNYKATLSFFSKRNDKKLPNASAILTAKFGYTFQAPRNTVFDVLEHSIKMAVGAKLVWKGDKTAKAKAGILSLNLDINDSKLTTNRNWSFAQLDHVAILERMTKGQDKLSLAGKTTVNGNDAYIIKLKGAILDDDVTEENIAVDAKTFMLISDEVYAGDDLIFKLGINVEATNTNLDPSTFDL